MTENQVVEKSNCRFKVVGDKVNPRIQIELFQSSGALLKDAMVELELLNGTSAQQARSLVEAMNDRILGITVRKAAGENPATT
ncbi:MAG: hypothetical protein ABR874_01620 [Candidatus Sulfotelmatobacter sp.]|jgi:hypothetical protein